MHSSADPSSTFTIFPLGDSALTIDLGNCIDDQINRRVLTLYDWIQANQFPGITDVIVAYSSLSVFYDPYGLRSSRPECGESVYYFMKRWLEQAWQTTLPPDTGENPSVLPSTNLSGSSFRIPVCYEGEYGPDLDWVAREKGLNREELIHLHSNPVYQVYMIGFLPGFPYMGKTDPLLEVPRKQNPVPVIAGGVGIAGIQTGIYPLNSPGGWQIIGRTPLQLFNPASDPPIRLQAGDRVQFYRVSAEEFVGYLP